MRIEQGSGSESIQWNREAKTEKQTRGQLKAVSDLEIFENLRTIQIKDPTYAKSSEESAFPSEKEDHGTDIRLQMETIANTMSTEDYSRLLNDGYQPDDMDCETLVTVVDKIKIALAKGGKDVSDLGTGLSKEELLAAGETVVSVNMLHQAFEAKDIPATKTNMSEGLEAMDRAAQIRDLSRGSMAYLLKNKMDPTIENVTKAVFSGSSDVTAMGQGKELEAQVERVISEAGYEVTESLRQDGNWMLQNEIALTDESFQKLQELKEITFPIELEMLTKSIADTVAAGSRPKDTLILYSSSLEERADSFLRNLHSDAAFLNETNADSEHADAEVRTTAEVTTESTILEITQQRQLEEVRLLMTKQACIQMLKQGIEVDTLPLEELIDQLKEQEISYYASLLREDTDSLNSKAAMLVETDKAITQIKQAPVYLLADPDIRRSSLFELKDKASVLTAAATIASSSYEAMMTEPRKDLGDSLQKAFGAIDSLLSEIGEESSQENQRAVRALAYNHMEINQESVAQVKEADALVQKVFRNLNPVVVLEMIRNGQNPMEMSLQELNQAAEAISEESGREDEKFSQFLWKLDQNGEITEEERSGYIGVYRLLHQIEQSDGAAVGAVIAKGMEMNLSNLLTAVRSTKKTGSEFLVDDTFDGMKASSKDSITDQIQRAFIQSKVSEAKEILSQLSQSETNEYLKEQTEIFDKAVKSEQEIYQLLAKYDTPVTANYLQAASRFINQRNKTFSSLFESNGSNSVTEEDFTALRDEILRRFSDAMESPEELAKAQNDLAEVAENVMKTMISESEDVTSLNLKEMKLSKMQVSIMQKMNKDEVYTIPVIVEGKMTEVSLKIVRGKEEKGKVDIFFDSEQAGKVAASLEVNNDEIRAWISCDSKEQQEKFQQELTDEVLSERFGESTTAFFAQEEKVSASSFYNTDSGSEPEEEQNTNQTRRLYHLAKEFLGLLSKSAA
ncbi:MAG: DUF6240 domain-containing protein [Lachnospiraceae bacterium]